MTDKPHLILAVAAFLSSCHMVKVATESGHGMSVDDRIARGIDWDNRPLPADRNNLSIIGPTGEVRFTVPNGWHIQDQPGLNKPSYTLTHDGTFGNLPFLRVELLVEERGRLSESRSHQARLGDIHTNFPSARMRPVGSVKLADGRSIRIVEYVHGDVPEYASFVAEKDCVTAVFLSAEDATALKHNRTAFEAVLRSYSLK